MVACMTTKKKHKAGAWVALVPGTSAHSVFGDRAQSSELESIAKDDPDYIALLDPVYLAPRICLKEHLLVG